MCTSQHWNQVLDAQLKKMGLQQCTSDPCIYTSKKDGLFIIAIYVDDILLAAKSEKRIAQVKCDLAKRFQLKDMENSITSLELMSSKILRLEKSGLDNQDTPRLCYKILVWRTVSELILEQN